MTPDFAEGVISQCGRVIAEIQDRLKNGEPALVTAHELQMLSENIRMDMQEAERTETQAVEIHCSNCEAYQPLQCGEWTRDGEHEFQDQLCGACHFVIATLRGPLEKAQPQSA